MRKSIAEVYRSAGFILLGTLIGSWLTLAIQGKFSTYEIVLGAMGLLGLGILVASARRNKPGFFLALSLLFAVSAAGDWMNHRKLADAIGLAFVALTYAGSAWVEHAEQRRKRAEEIAQSI